jgi:hypothetical protein
VTSNPYKNFAGYAFWRRSVSATPLTEVDPVIRAVFPISGNERVATAGSCFAQHIARRLQDKGFNYYVTEKAHPVVPDELVQQYNYGTFSARYGNIYTSRQLLQLLQRIYGEFQPQEDIWESDDGSFVDPFRPQIQPGGFTTRNEYLADRAQHFARAREAIEGLNVFVFTLGLTECWRSRTDGAVFPLCPGVAGGKFDPAQHEFINLNVDDVTKDLLASIDLIRERNRAAKIILTVSPVPLVATAEDRHILVSTTYSKSVLRVAAEMVSQARLSVAYFPSYEVITGSFNRGRYFADDLRSVTEEGVDHVMRLFFRHYMGTPEDTPEISAPPAREKAAAGKDAHTAEMARLADLNCDEEALDRG